MIETEAFRDFELLDVPEEEPGGANVLLIEEVVIMPASFPKTRARLEERGLWREVRTLDLSELQKAEAGVTCTSLIFKDIDERSRIDVPAS